MEEGIEAEQHLSFVTNPHRIYTLLRIFLDPNPTNSIRKSTAINRMPEDFPPAPFRITIFCAQVPGNYDKSTNSGIPEQNVHIFLNNCEFKNQ